jgi:hypothetical protein
MFTKRKISGKFWFRFRTADRAISENREVRTAGFQLGKRSPASVLSPGRGSVEGFSLNQINTCCLSLEPILWLRAREIAEAN